MKAVTRDPRVDPRPGDVLAVGNDRRKVTGTAKGAVWIDTGNGRYAGRTIGQWRKWAKKAVVRRAAK